MADNGQRAEWGLAAVRTNPDFEHNELDTNVSDTLANIRHLCREQDIDFDQCVATAEMHFNYETDPVKDEEVNECYCSAGEEE